MTSEREDRLRLKLKTQTSGFILQKNDVGKYSISHSQISDFDFPRWQDLTLEQADAIADDLVDIGKRDHLVEALPRFADNFGRRGH